MVLRAVIFDLDDTLVVEEATARESLRSAARALPGIDPDGAVDVILSAVRRVWRAGPHYRLAATLGIASWEGLWSRFEGDHPCLTSLAAWAPAYRRTAWTEALEDLGLNDPGLAQAMASAYEHAQQSGHQLVPGAMQAVRGAARYRLGLLTNGPADIQRHKLEHTGLAAEFDSVAVSGEIGVGKPEAAAFAVVLAGLGVRADEAVMVGDSWDRDILGALTAGMAAIWLSNGRPAPAAVHGVTVVASIADLPGALAAVDA